MSKNVFLYVFQDRSLLNPPEQTLFQEKLLELKESVYTSRKKAPLGRSRHQAAQLPSWFTHNTTFGIKTVEGAFGVRMSSQKHAALKCGWVKVWVNKSKEVKVVFESILQDWMCARSWTLPKQQRRRRRKLRRDMKLTVEVTRTSLLVRSDWFLIPPYGTDLETETLPSVPGEQIDRKYDSRSFSDECRFGILTPHFNDGRRVGKTLRWLGETQKWERRTKLFNVCLNVQTLDHP